MESSKEQLIAAVDRLRLLMYNLESDGEFEITTKDLEAMKHIEYFCTTVLDKTIRLENAESRLSGD